MLQDIGSLAFAKHLKQSLETLRGDMRDQINACNHFMQRDPNVINELKPLMDKFQSQMNEINELIDDTQNLINALGRIQTALDYHQRGDYLGLIGKILAYTGEVKNA